MPSVDTLLQIAVFIAVLAAVVFAIGHMMGDDTAVEKPTGGMADVFGAIEGFISPGKAKAAEELQAQKERVVPMPSAAAPEDLEIIITVKDLKPPTP